jgi:O-antigen/teichoic acid export membrane protein
MSEMKQGSITKLGMNSILYFVSMVLPKVAGFFLLPIYSCYIEPNDYAILAYTGSFTSFLSILSALGLNAFYLRNYSRATDKKEFNGTVYWFMCLWNIMLFLISIPIIKGLFVYLNSPIPFLPFMGIALLTQFFFSMEIIPMRTFRIRGEAKSYLIRVACKAILNVLLIIVLVVWLKWGILGKFYAELINSAIFAIIFIAYMYRNSYLHINFTLLCNGLKFSLPIVPSDLLQVSVPSLKNLIIEKVLSMTQLGIYSIGATISSMAQMVTSSIALAIEPEMYVRATSKDYPIFAMRLKNIEMLVISWFCVGCGLFIREVIFSLLSEKYWLSWPIAQVLLISFIIAILKDFYGQLLIIQDRTRILVWGNIGNLVANVVVCWYLVPIYGIEMLGWSASIGYLLMFIIYYIATDRSNFAQMNHSRDFMVIIFCAVLLYGSRAVNNMNLGMVILIKSLIFIVFTIILTKIYGITMNMLINGLDKVRNLVYNKF